MPKIRTSDFQVAKAVPITDAGSYFTGTEVETALQEVGAGTAIDHGLLQGLADGADHSFIDQDVTSGSTPTFTGTNFTGIDISAGTNLAAGTSLTLTDDTLSVDDDFVKLVGDTMSGDLLIYDAVNDANPQIRIGSADADEAHIQTVYNSGAQILDYLLISTESTQQGDIALMPKGNLGVGTLDPESKLSVFKGDASNIDRTPFSFEVQGNTALEAEMLLKRSRAAGASLANDDFGIAWKWFFMNDTPGYVEGAAIKTQMTDVSAISEDVTMIFETIVAGSSDVRMVIYKGNLGIGIGDPDELLELYKVGTQLKLSGGAADYATFAVAADGALTVTTVDTDAAEGDIILMPDGKVGIGTGDPSVKFEIREDGVATKTFLITDTTNNAGMGLTAATDAASYLHFGDTDDDNIGEIKYDHSTNKMLFRTNTNFNVVIDTNGYVGVGTTTPIAKIHIESGTGTLPALTTDQAKGLIISNLGGYARLALIADNTLKSILDFGDDDDSAEGGIQYLHHATVDEMQFYVHDSQKMTILQNGRVGIGTTVPGQIFDVNDGSGNMIADGYDSHPSFLANKVDPVEMTDVLTKFKQVKPYQYKKIPFVSADELATAAIAEFGEEKWDTAFPDGYRDGKLRDCPDPKILAFLDNLGDSLRTKRSLLPKWQRLHYSLALDDLAETFPDILSRNDEGEVTGYSFNSYVGLLHACIAELLDRVETLENSVVE